MNILLDENAFVPQRAHDTDAGLDLFATEDHVIPAGGSYTFDTGVHVELPRVCLSDGFGDVEFITAGILKSKSGLNVNHNITSDGTIDFGYTGSIRVKLYNHGHKDYLVKRGDKISQLVIVPVLTPEIRIVEALTDTARGEGGFGSTGR